MALCMSGRNSTRYVGVLETPQLLEDGVLRLTSVSILELDHYDAQDAGDLTDQQLRGGVFCGLISISEGESEAIAKQEENAYLIAMCFHQA
jgi:hypothetical protein